MYSTYLRLVCGLHTDEPGSRGYILVAYISADSLQISLVFIVASICDGRMQVSGICSGSMQLFATCKMLKITSSQNADFNYPPI